MSKAYQNEYGEEYLVAIPMIKRIHSLKKKGFLPKLDLPYLMSLLIFVVICGFSQCQSNGHLDGKSIWEMFFIAKEQLVAEGEWCSAFYIIANIRNLQWFRIMFPVLVGTSCVYNFYEQWNDSFFYMILPRKGRLGYALEILCKSILSGMSIVIIGYAIFTALVYMHFPQISEFHLLEEESIIAAIYGITRWELAVVVIKQLVGLILVAGLFCAALLIMTAFIRDRFYALSIPVAIQFLMMKLTDVYYLLLFQIYGLGAVPRAAYALLLINPYTIFDMDGLYQNLCGIPLVMMYAWTVLLIIIGCVLFIQMVKRRTA